MADPPIACGGRKVDDHGRHTGDDCPRVFRPHGIADGREQARAAGWGILLLPDGTVSAVCPRCRRPNPGSVAACRDLAATLHKGTS